MSDTMAYYVITIQCKCGYNRFYDKAVDGTIPRSVVRIVTEACSECNDGDLSGETWFDKNGNEVSQNV